MQLSIIVPVFNEVAAICRTLAFAVAATATDDADDAETEIIVVDGGSSDATRAVVEAFAMQERCRITVIESQRGRANQMNAGAAMAAGDVLLFLHADTLLPVGAGQAIIHGLREKSLVWGRFDVHIEGHARMLKVVAFCMNLRSRLTGIATGDQAIFVMRQTFVDADGFSVQPLMEDIALSRILKRRSAPLCLPDKVITSGRRWESNGVWRTILLMWTLRLQYWLGASPERLKRAYR